MLVARFSLYCKHSLHCLSSTIPVDAPPRRVRLLLLEEAAQKDVAVAC